MKHDFSTTAKWGHEMFTALALGCLLSASVAEATQTNWVNDGVISLSEPPYNDPIDAVNFLNNGTITFSGLFPYQTFNTLNFTNVGTIAGFPGYDFRTHPEPYGASQMAASFRNTGTLDASQVSFFLDLGLGTFVTTGARLKIGATNVFLRSTLALSEYGQMGVEGHDVDMSRSVTTMGERVGAGTQLPDYWGVGKSNVLNIAEDLENPLFVATPPHEVTYRPDSATIGPAYISLFNYDFYLDDEIIAPSNRLARGVYIQNTSTDTATQVYFTPDEVIVEWATVVVDPFTGLAVDVYIYLFDDFGTTTNLSVFPTNFVPASPVNYTFFTTTSQLPLGTSAPQTTPEGVYTGGNATTTNDYAAYSMTFSATTERVSTLYGGSSQPGNVQIEAHENLDLKLIRMSTPNYLSLKATNHFSGAEGSKILAAFSDIDLASTNGNLVISNLLMSTVPKVVGDVQVYSTRWTNTEEVVVSNGVTNTMTNSYSALYVDSVFQSGTNTLVGTLKLRSDDSIVISDEFNILSNALIEARSLTITTNVPNVYNANGGALNFWNALIQWSDAVPSVEYLTNQGTLSSGNAVYYGSAGNPYKTFVNSGLIDNQSTLIWADYFENSGVIYPGGGFLYDYYYPFGLPEHGSITATFGQGVLSNGMFQILDGDIKLTGDSLVVANHDLNAGRELLLDIGDFLDDGGATNDNQWSAGPWGGVRVLKRPMNGDLLGTTISISLGEIEEAPIEWAGADLGCDQVGFETNAALKRLELYGDDYSAFLFEGAAPGNALYVETLSLNNYATNVNGYFPSIEIEPDFTVYYARALAGAVEDVSEELNGAVGGRLCWVSNYVGAFSSVAIQYSATETVMVNAALAASMVIDSDADGTVNGLDTTPIYTGSQVHLKLSLTPSSPAEPQLTWDTLPGADNVVLYKDSIVQAGWLTLTNFTSSGNTATLVDHQAGAAGRVYRVQVNPQVSY